MKHVMIDLETLGTKVDSVFLSLAAVQFDLDTGATGNEFVANVHLDSATAAGRKIDANTLQWWLTQRPEIMAKMFTGASDINTVLDAFRTWWKGDGCVYPWGNGATFDISILEHAYDAKGEKAPWMYTNIRCYRTIMSLFKKNDPRFPEKSADAHDPLVDCKYQILKLTTAMKLIRV